MGWGGKIAELTPRLLKRYAAQFGVPVAAAARRLIDNRSAAEKIIGHACDRWGAERAMSAPPAIACLISLLSGIGLLGILPSATLKRLPMLMEEGRRMRRRAWKDPVSGPREWA